MILWTNNSKDHHQKAITHQTTKFQLDHFISTSYSHSNDGLNQVVWDINIFDSTAELSNLKQYQHHKSKKISQ